MMYLQEVEKKIKELHASCDELRREITQRQAEGKNLNEDLQSNKKDLIADRKVFEEANEEKERLKVCFPLQCINAKIIFHQSQYHCASYCASYCK